MIPTRLEAYQKWRIKTHKAGRIQTRTARWLQNEKEYARELVRKLQDCKFSEQRQKVFAEMEEVFQTINQIAEDLGADETLYVIRRVKPLSELTPLDVPPGLEPEDVATDCGQFQEYYR